MLLGISVALIWGMGIVFAKAALEYFPPILLMAFRFSLSALLLIWFVKVPRPLLGRICLIALVSAAIQYGLTFGGLKYLDASTAVLVVQLEVPFLVILGAIFLRERPSLKKILGIAFAFGGVALIAGEPRLAGQIVPILMVLGGAFSWGVGQIMVRSLGPVGGFTLIAWVSVFAAPQLFIASFIFERDQIRLIQEANWIVWGTVVYLGLIMTAFGYAIWYHLLGKYPVSRAAPFLLLLPVFTILGGVLLLGEGLSLQTALGGAVVIAGVAAITVERSRTPAPEAAKEG